MNSELLALGTSVFYLGGTTNECVLATIVGSSSKADCVAIQYERSGHSQLVMMRQKCVCCVANGAPPWQFAMSVRSTIVMNVLTPTLVGPMLFVNYK